jgi:hypothetical protein
LKYFTYLFAVLIAVLLPVACNQGTESGTETGLQGIQGGLSREGAIPVVGAEVYAFRRAAANTLSDSAVLIRVLQNPDTLKDSLHFKSTLTDAQGQYRFTNLDAGNYGILGFYVDSVQKGKWVGYNPTVKVSALTLTEAGTLDLRRLGGISAVVVSASPAHTPLENVMCHIPGLSYVAFSDAEGNCALLNVPEGTYSMAFDQSGYISRKYGPVTVESGTILSLPDTIRLTRDPTGPPAAPKGLSFTVDADARIVTLKWEPVEVSDVVGYILYRRPIDSIGNVIETPLTNTLVRSTSYIDTLYKSLPDTAAITYVYRLEAMDAEGNHSSSALLTPVHVTAASSPISIEFTQTEFAGREGVGTLSSMVRRLGPSNRTVTVKWNLQDSTALRNSDFASVTGEMTFAPGDTVQTLPVLILNDNWVEPTEIFFARLLEPSNGAILGAQPRAKLNLADDDSLTRLVCDQPVRGIKEGDSAKITIRRLGDAVRAASVHYAILADPSTGAKPNEDFIADSGMLEFAQGVNGYQIPVHLINDTVEERSERILLRLTRPSRDVDISACPDINMEIIDNDTNYSAAPVDLSKATVSHNSISGLGLNRFPRGLFDGDTSSSGLSEYRSSNPQLILKPIALWNFQDCGQSTITDRTGNGHVGEVTGTLVCRSDSAVSSLAGTWAQFSKDAMVSSPFVPDLEFGQSLTVTAMVRPDSLNFIRTIIGRLYGPTAFTLGISDGNWDFNIVIEDGSTEGRSYNISAPATIGIWTHIAATYDGTLARLYVNGEIVSEIPISGKIKATDRPITIGNFPSWNRYAGGMKEIKLFKQALNPAQIREQSKLSDLPAIPLQVTFAFPQAIWTMGVAAELASALGTQKYSWTLTAADSQSDLDAGTGSFITLTKISPSLSDVWSRSAYKPRAFKVFRFTFMGLSGTGFVQINELSLTGAERIKL